MSQQFTKDPDATLDYSIEWSKWLAGDTIQTSQWTVPNGLTQASSSNTTTKATVWLSGGTPGQLYTVTNRITTVGGRTDERSITIRVEER
ncbi:MAG: hypothetical protein HYX72_13620 [Acidobacteria bacterium]|nr:hypothetical protein [Acidobacteriota bacterium]